MTVNSPGVSFVPRYNLDILPGQVVIPNFRNRMGEDFAQFLQMALD